VDRRAANAKIKGATMASDSQGTARTITRRTFVRGAAGAALLPLNAREIGKAAAQPARGKPFAGETLNVFMFDHPYPRALKELLPQFTELTGIKVEMDTPGFLVYNQRADLELSTGSGAYDVMALTFIFSGKWIGAGWASRLNDFIARDSATDATDFLSGAMAPMKSGSDVFALPFVAESTLMVYRRDVFEKAGLKPPDTFDELLAAAPKIQTPEMKAYMGPGARRLPLDLAELSLRLRRQVLRRSAEGPHPDACLCGVDQVRGRLRTAVPGVQRARCAELRRAAVFERNDGGPHGRLYRRAGVGWPRR
jgi:spermidine/putrescine-binding protein